MFFFFEEVVVVDYGVHGRRPLSLPRNAAPACGAACKRRVARQLSERSRWLRNGERGRSRLLAFRVVIAVFAVPFILTTPRSIGLRNGLLGFRLRVLKILRNVGSELLGPGGFSDVIQDYA